MAYIKIKQLKDGSYFRFKGKKKVYKFLDLGQIKAYYSSLRVGNLAGSQYVTKKLSSLVEIVKS